MAKRIDWGKSRADTLRRELIREEAQEAQANSDKWFNFKSKEKNHIKLIEKGICPIGNHKGKQISKLDEKYLIWAGKTLDGLNKHCRYAANTELLRRYHSGEIKL